MKSNSALRCDSSTSESLCRYCFEDGTDEKLIAPCLCCGDQRYVHLSCLRRWQRMVLVDTPAHPIFWTEDERYKTCTVCKGTFTCPIPTRWELVESFIGKEFGKMIQEQGIIRSTEDFDEVCKMYSRNTPFRKKSLDNFANSSYVICRINEARKVSHMWIEDKTSQHQWATLFNVQPHETTLPPRNFSKTENAFPVLGRGCLRNVTDLHDVAKTIMAQTLPALLVTAMERKDLKPQEMSYHKLHLVNLNRPYVLVWISHTSHTRSSHVNTHTHTQVP